MRFRQNRAVEIRGFLFLSQWKWLGLGVLAVWLAVMSAPSQAGLPAGGRAVLEVPAIEAKSLSVRDKALRTRFEKIAQFAEPCEVSANKTEYGVWEDAGSGRVLWRLFISAPGATDLNLGITEIFIPEGCTLKLVSADGSYAAGPYTFKDNTAARQLWTPVVPGDWISLEAEMPADVVSQFTLVIGRVNRGYADVFKNGFPGLEKQGTCNNDVICSAGDGWRNEIRSVARYSISGTYLCSGTLIMNQRADFKAYFLTAAHCLSTVGEAVTVVVYWNYQSPTCGSLSGGALSQNQSGASLRATYSSSDFTLLELNNTPSPAFGVYYAGWDRTGNGASSAVCIHHPSGDEKAISFENNALQSTAYTNTTVPDGSANHWRVIDWDSGTTETGSSGAGLWNASNRRLIGQLHGGYALCGNDLSDWFGKLSTSWVGGGTSASRLSSWLDPDSTGLTGMDGSNPPAPTETALGDYDGDGISDLAIFDTMGGYWYITGSNGVLADANQWGWSTAKPVAGDYNGDGVWDQAVFDTAGGYWYIKTVSGSIITWANQWGWSTAKQVAGDYNGDGVWDQAVFDTVGGYWYIKTISGSVITWKNQWGWSAAKPVPGDYDGDGAYDLAVFDTVGGYWYIKNLAGNAITWKNQWGWSTAKPVPGDYDGDGKFDLAVFDPAGGNWYIKSLAGNVIIWANAWGWSKAVPVPGDFDGDTRADQVVYDTISGQWFLKSISGNIIDWAVPWGWLNAFPVSLLDLPTPDSRTSAEGYRQMVQNTLDTSGFTAAVNYAKTAGAVGKVFVFSDGSQKTVRDIDIRDDDAGVWVVGAGTTTSRSWSTYYFYVGSDLRMRVYLGW